MAVVERRQFAFTEPLHDGKYGRVDEAEREITITTKQFPNARYILCLQVDELEAAVFGVSKETQKRVGTKSLAGKPIQLNDNWRWDEHRLGGCL